VVLLVGVAMPIILRLLWEPEPDSFYRPNANPLAFVVTLARQVYAALPLSYWGAKPHFPRLEMVRQSSPAAFGLSLSLAFAVLLRLARSGDLTLRGRGPLLALVAVWLWVAVGVPIATSPRYQNEVVTGICHLPVYVSYYGVGLLGAWLFTRLLVRCRQMRSLIIPLVMLSALPLAMVLTITHAVNRRVVSWAAPGRDQRANLIRALQAGMLDPVPDGSALLIHQECPLVDYQRSSPYFYSTYAGKKLDIYSTRWTVHGFALPGEGDLTDPFARIPCLRDVASAGAEVYEMVDASTSDTQGWAVLSRLTAPPSPGEGPKGSRLTNHVRVFARDRKCRKGTLPSFYLMGEYRGARPEAFLVSSRSLVPVEQGEDWTLYACDVPNGYVDAASLEVRWVAPEPIGTYWSDAFLHLVEDPTPNQWCSKRRGSLWLVNDSEKATTCRLSLSLQAIDKRTVILDSPLFHETVAVGPEPVFLSRCLRLPPGGLRITFTSENPNSPAPGDPRGFFFRVGDFDLVEVGEYPNGETVG
jgi:hypothetical protein